MTYTVTAVGKTPQPYETKYGTKLAYRLRFKETGDTIISLGQKQTTPAPSIGDRLEGTVDMSAPYGPKFTKDFNQLPGSPGAKSGGGPRDDKAIKAQFAIKAAVQALPNAPVADGEEQTDAYLAHVEVLAQGFYAMVERVKATPSDEPKSFKDELDDVDMKDQLNALDAGGDGLDDDLPPEDL